MDAAVAPGHGPPISGHELLLWLAGRVDDDLLAVGRELVAVGEEAAALELIVATLAAARTALPLPVRDGLVDIVERRLGPGLARMVPPGVPHGDTSGHRFAPSCGVPEAAERIATIVEDLAIVARSGARTALAWRLTPAGAAPGPLPHPVVLLALSDPAPAEVLAYQVGAALGRAGVAASVEAFVDGPTLPPYQRAALAASWTPALSTPDVLGGGFSVPREPGSSVGPVGGSYDLGTDPGIRASDPRRLDDGGVAGSSDPVSTSTGSGPSVPRSQRPGPIDAAQRHLASDESTPPPHSTEVGPEPRDPGVASAAYDHDRHSAYDGAGFDPAQPREPARPGFGESSDDPVPDDSGSSRPTPVDPPGHDRTPPGSGPAGSPPAGSGSPGPNPTDAAGPDAIRPGTDHPGAAPHGLAASGPAPPGSSRPGMGPTGSAATAPDRLAPSVDEPIPPGSSPAGSWSGGSASGGSSPAGSWSAGPAPVEPWSGGSASGGPASAGSSPAGSPSTGSTPAGSWSGGFPPAGTPPVGSPPVGSAPGGSPPAESWSAGSPSTGSPSTGSPSTGSPSVGSPSVGSPSAGSPSTGSPSAGSASGGPASAGSSPSPVPTSTGPYPRAAGSGTDRTGTDHPGTVSHGPTSYGASPGGPPESGPVGLSAGADPGGPVPLDSRPSPEAFDPSGSEWAPFGSAAGRGPGGSAPFGAVPVGPPVGAAPVEPARFDPARNLGDTAGVSDDEPPTGDGAHPAPGVGGPEDRYADDRPSTSAAGPRPRPGPVPGQEPRDGTNGHPSPRPSPRRSVRPGPYPGPRSGPPAGPDPDDAPVAGEQSWSDQWSDGSWSVPGGERPSSPDPDMEPATSPTPTSPPLGTVSPSPVPRAPEEPEPRGTGALAPADPRPRHRLDAADGPEPDGTSVPASHLDPSPAAVPNDRLDSRLTPNEQELLRRLQEELAARESGGSGEAPRNGAAHPDQSDV